MSQVQKKERHLPIISFNEENNKIILATRINKNIDMAGFALDISGSGNHFRYFRNFLKFVIPVLRHNL